MRPVHLAANQPRERLYRNTRGPLSSTPPMFYSQGESE
jgi:hypothetical protein